MHSLICLIKTYLCVFMQNEITLTYIISKIEITWKHTFTLVTRTQSISQQNPAVVYAKSFQIVIQRQFV